VTTSFPYTFRIFHASDLVVMTSDTNGTLRTLTLNTDYTVTGAGSYSGGVVVLPVPLANAWTISIERSLPVVQETDLRNQGKFFAETHEGAFDYLTMLIQQCFGWARLALLKPSFIARYYDAKQNRIANLADPGAEQDAVNNRSMRNYVDAAISGVVGGFGWFIQYGAGAVYRTFQDKMRDSVSVLDFVPQSDRAAITSGAMDATSAFNAASAAYPDGVYVPAGRYVIPSNINGKFWGPGRRIFAAGDTVSVPFANTGQSLANLIWGYDAGKIYSGSDTAGQVVLLGPYAGRNVSTGTNITAVGVGTLSGDTLVDALTDLSPFTGTEVIGIGVNACKKAVTASNLIGIGRDALNENKFGNFNIAIGSSALQQLHTGSNNVAVGRAAGMRAGMVTDSSGVRLSFNVVNGCTFFGNAAGREITSGDNNTYVGNNAGRGVTSSTNSFTGTATGSGNTALGADSLNSVGTASYNVMLGNGAGKTLSSGNYNIFIGYSAGSGVALGDNQLIIANQSGLPFLQGLMGPVSDANNYARFDASLQAATDNTRTLGSGGRRWSQLFAGTATINTSDGRVKTDISDLEEAEKRVAQKLKGMMRRFRYIDAVAEKEANGEKARWHFGVIAQDVQKAFADEGLDAHEYGLFCHDKWETEYKPVMATKTVIDDETGQETEMEYDTGEKEVLIEAGDRYGIRYEELLCFIIAAI
ncbi:TPA: tail fiber domain-containing protein, partial [Enterobacter roggenkampii]